MKQGLQLDSIQLHQIKTPTEHFRFYETHPLHERYLHFNDNKIAVLCPFKKTVEVYFFVKFIVPFSTVKLYSKWLMAGNKKKKPIITAILIMLCNALLCTKGNLTSCLEYNVHL